jgi:membrane protease YdiL (CAAX protease family)
LPRILPPDLPRRAIVAVMLLLVSLLLVQAWIAAGFAAAGHARDHAVNLARMLTLPTLVTLVWLVVRPWRAHFQELLALDALTPRLILQAAAIGLLARVAAWAELTFRGAAGLVRGAREAAPRDFMVGLECPSPEVLLVAAVTWLVLVPFTEEFVHRAVIQGWLQRFGTWPAIIASSVVFTAMHQPSSYAWVFIMGLLLGFQFRVAGSLWPPIITHATYDGLRLLDTVCARLAWNPAPETIPRWDVAIWAGGVCLLCAALILVLVRRYPAPANRPRAGYSRDTTDRA